MKVIIIGAGSDLGVHVDGGHLAPIQLMNDLKSFYSGEEISFIQENTIIKSRNLSDRRKNEYEVDKYNNELYKIVLQKIKEGYVPITIGGDHSISIPTALASAKENNNIGLIYFGAQPDYNTFSTTMTGNIEGLANAAINNYKVPELNHYHDGNIVQTSKTIIVGARNIAEKEKENIKYSGVTLFTTEDIKQKGISSVIEEAFRIAEERTKGVHITFNVNIIDPDIAPGVSSPEFDGITEEDAMEINKVILQHAKQILSYDIVGFNPLRDMNRKTEQITLNILAQIIKGIENRDKYLNKKY